ncbi:uncharacterized protein M6D78_011403 isoform 2-T2 [Vipera latastei]
MYNINMQKVWSFSYAAIIGILTTKGFVGSEAFIPVNCCLTPSPLPFLKHASNLTVLFPWTSGIGPYEAKIIEASETPKTSWEGYKW